MSMRPPHVQAQREDDHFADFLASIGPEAAIAYETLTAEEVRDAVECRLHVAGVGTYCGSAARLGRPWVCTRRRTAAAKLAAG